ncbi:MAG: DUF6427 family protein [Bacteroidales bacterium]|nr:DUF6427 family protein [Bacteroidales bacterium]MDD2424709.1 DUF6427 family protein [Bacteroidales bacterium]MDD3989276.1 DUF6427 family protein [Bacteroidales bacterium]MDD4639435.1 DUF6427 family protein [Bacteroidales bacterium]
MSKSSGYNFVVSPLFLGILCLITVISDFISGGFIADNGETGAVFLKLPLNGYSTVILSLIAIISLLVLLYRFNEIKASAGKSSLTVILLCLLLISSGEGYLSFPERYISALMVAGALYYSVCKERNQSELFLANFFISAAALAQPLVLFLIPVILYFSLRSSVTNARNIVIALIGIILPFVITLSILFLFRVETDLYSVFISVVEKAELSFPFRGGLPEAVSGIALFLYILFSIYHILKRINRFKVIKSKYFARIITLLAVSAAVSLLYSSDETDIRAITAIPASLAAAEYSASDNSSPGKRVLLLVLLILYALLKISRAVQL